MASNTAAVPRRYITAVEAARIAERTPARIRQLVKEHGAQLGYKHLGRVRVDEAELLRRITPPTDPQDPPQSAA